MDDQQRVCVCPHCDGFGYDEKGRKCQTCDGYGMVGDCEVYNSVFTPNEEVPDDNQ